MVWVKIFRLLFHLVKNLGNSVFYNVTLLSTLFLLIAEVVDSVFFVLPLWMQNCLHWILLGIFVLSLFLFVYGYVRSKWVRKAVVWMNIINRYKRDQLLNPYWKDGKTLARQLDHLETKMGLVIGALESGELSLKEAAVRCKVYVNAAWMIVNEITTTLSVSAESATQS